MWNLLLEAAAWILFHLVTPRPASSVDIGGINAQARRAREAGMYEEAGRLSQLVLEARRARYGEKHRLTALAGNNLAIAQTHLERWQSAEKLYQTTLQVLKEVQGPDHPEVARVLCNLGWMYFRKNDYSRAESYLQRALAVYRIAPFRENISHLSAVRWLAWVRFRQNRLEEAMSLAELTRAGFVQLRETDHAAYIDVLDLLCVLYNNAGRAINGIPFFRWVTEARERTLRTQDALYGTWLSAYAHACIRAKRLQEAESLLERAIAHQRLQGAVANTRFALNLSHLGTLLVGREEYAAAEPLLAEALPIFVGTPDFSEKALANVLTISARTAYKLQRWSEAEDRCHQALAISARSKEVLFAPRSRCCVMLGRMCSREGRLQEAEDHLRAAQVLIVEHEGCASASYAGILTYLAELYVRHGKNSDAQLLLDEALALFARVEVKETTGLDLARSLASQITMQEKRERRSGAL